MVGIVSIKCHLPADVNATVYRLSVKCRLPAVGKHYHLPTVGKVSSSNTDCWKSVGKVSGAFTDLAKCR